VNLFAQASTEEFSLDGMSIVEAIAPVAIHELLGAPSRIHSAGPPAPHGHRNNQINVYDSLGIYFNEHHHTRLLSGMSFVFWPEAEAYPFSPTAGFIGRLQLGRYEVPCEVSETAFIADCGLPFDEVLRGMWHLKAKISIGANMVAPKLKSGRRSKTRSLATVSIGWPHDPHAKQRD